MLILLEDKLSISFLYHRYSRLLTLTFNINKSIVMLNTCNLTCYSADYGSNGTRVRAVIVMLVAVMIMEFKDHSFPST